MTLIVYRILTCSGCTAQYPPPQADLFTGSNRELRDAAEAVGWQTSKDDVCPKCRIRHIQHAASMAMPAEARR